MAVGLPLDSEAADATEPAPMSEDEGPASLPGRAVPTALKGKRPATKSKAGQQGTTAAAIALKGAASTGSASASALHAEREMPANDCSARSAGQGIRKGPARRQTKKKGVEIEQQQC